jgi:tRNA(ile)-lysidine synthase
MKKIWQELSVPPWQRNRIPLIFYDRTLQSAVGFFRVFHEK